MQPRELTFEALYGPRYGGEDIPDSRERQEANMRRDQHERDFVGAVELDALAARSMVVAHALQQFAALGLGKPALARFESQPTARLVFPDARIVDPLMPVSRPTVVAPRRRFVAAELLPAKTFLDHPPMAADKIKRQQVFLTENELDRYFEEVF